MSVRVSALARRDDRCPIFINLRHGSGEGHELPVKRAVFTADSFHPITRLVATRGPHGRNARNPVSALYPVSQAERAPARSIVTHMHTFDRLSGCTCAVTETRENGDFPRGEGLLERCSCSSRANPAIASLSRPLYREWTSSLH